VVFGLGPSAVMTRKVVEGSLSPTLMGIVVLVSLQERFRAAK
jgi:hypothetical protein